MILHYAKTKRKKKRKKQDNRSSILWCENRIIELFEKVWKWKNWDLKEPNRSEQVFRRFRQKTVNIVFASFAPFETILISHVNLVGRLRVCLLN